MTPPRVEPEKRDITPATLFGDCITYILHRDRKACREDAVSVAVVSLPVVYSSQGVRLEMALQNNEKLAPLSGVNDANRLGYLPAAAESNRVHSGLR